MPGERFFYFAQPERILSACIFSCAEQQHTLFSVIRQPGIRMPFSRAKPRHRHRAEGDRVGVRMHFTHAKPRRRHRAEG